MPLTIFFSKSLGINIQELQPHPRRQVLNLQGRWAIRVHMWARMPVRPSITHGAITAQDPRYLTLKAKTQRERINYPTPMSAFVPGPPPATKLGRYRQLAPRAAIHVSPLALGGMSIGDKWSKFGMGEMDKESSFKLLDAYFDAGGE
jgi:hypothetical protein